MVLWVAQAYFKTAGNSRSIVEGIISNFQILTEDYINIEMSLMWNLEPRTIIDRTENTAYLNCSPPHNSIALYMSGIKSIFVVTKTQWNSLWILKKGLSCMVKKNKKTAKQLTENQRSFCAEYLVHGIGALAYKTVYQRVTSV